MTTFDPHSIFFNELSLASIGLTLKLKIMRPLVAKPSDESHTAFHKNNHVPIPASFVNIEGSGGQSSKVSSVRVEVKLKI